MQTKIMLELDTQTRNLNIKTDLSPGDTATILSQATTQCLLIDQQQRSLLINPLNSQGFKKNN